MVIWQGFRECHVLVILSSHVVTHFYEKWIKRISIILLSSARCFWDARSNCDSSRTAYYLVDMLGNAGYEYRNIDSLGWMQILKNAKRRDCTLPDNLFENTADRGVWPDHKEKWHYCNRRKVLLSYGKTRKIFDWLFKETFLLFWDCEKSEQISPRFHYSYFAESHSAYQLLNLFINFKLKF